MIADIGSTFFSILIGCLLLMWVANRFIKAVQQAKGHSRCAFCRARLKFLGVGASGQAKTQAGYADTCSKCGREQPWKKQETAF